MQSVGGWRSGAVGLEPIAWRGDQGQSPGDTAALPQFEMAATEFIFDASIGAF